MGDALFWINLAINAERVSLLVAGVVGVMRFRQLPRNLRYLGVLVWFGLAVEAVAYVFHSQHLPNLFLIPIDAAGEV